MTKYLRGASGKQFSGARNRTGPKVSRCRDWVPRRGVAHRGPGDLHKRNSARKGAGVGGAIAGLAPTPLFYANDRKVVEVRNVLSQNETTEM